MAEENTSQNQNQNGTSGSSNDGSFKIPTESLPQQPNQSTQSTRSKNEIVSNEPTGGLIQINREFQEKSVLKNAHELGLPYVNIGKTPLNPDFLKVLDIDTARKARIIPFFKVGTKLRVAVQDPQNPETDQVIKKLEKNGFQVSVNLASAAGIDDAMKIYEADQLYKKIDIVENVEEKAIKAYDKEITELSELAKKIETIPAEEALNMINVGAMKTGASDIHYEPTDAFTEVRFRIDGMLHKVFKIKSGVYRNIANQIKYKCAMQLNVESIPQDGRYSFMFNGNKIDVRVSAIPTGNGEAFVCRYLVPDKNHASFESMGFKGSALKKVENASIISRGMILCTGPTGSGKTTTLYTMMMKMKAETNKIITLEDPVEYYLDGVVQSQINEKRGYTFASGLRSILRQDPDIIMVGEIRDLETAETAAQAALTGHILLSTLHTNSAIETIPRLINMGLPRYMVASALDTIIAQRLVRTVCPKCSTKRPITKSESAEFEKVFTNLKAIHPKMEIAIPKEIPEIHGCDYCSQTGYKGRIVIDEVIVIDDKTKRLILENASSVDLIMAARQGGMITIREDGMIKVSEGLTTLEEIYRATNVNI
ncbi:MAG: GspE/PulE family protein [Candidatus Gracilibacteria bacterium]|nr:GspE/PulE family protein [Candidatus Gracilibacteria bacterium]